MLPPRQHSPLSTLSSSRRLDFSFWPGQDCFKGFPKTTAFLGSCFCKGLACLRSGREQRSTRAWALSKNSMFFTLLMLPSMFVARGRTTTSTALSTRPGKAIPTAMQRAPGPQLPFLDYAQTPRPQGQMPVPPSRQCLFFSKSDRNIIRRAGIPGSRNSNRGLLC